jgi:hypothetical protein
MHLEECKANDKSFTIATYGALSELCVDDSATHRYDAIYDTPRNWVT